MSDTELNSLAKAIAHTDWRTDAEKIEHLTEQWKRTKAALQAAQAEHLQSEIDIYNAVKDTLPKKGTTTLDSGLKIVTGYKEAYDQEKLNDAWNLWPEESKVPFPFSTEWKPDAKSVSYVKSHIPGLWKLLQDALTITEKKPAFSIKGEKE